MTGNLDMMVKFRDLQVAEAVGKKAALGWFDMEFTMYGCAYLDPTLGKMCYRVSERAEDIYDFAENSCHKGIYASNVVHMTKKYPVPSGMKNLIAQDVKKMLARELQKMYPRALFTVLDELAQGCVTDAAVALLDPQMEYLEGVFEEDRLDDFLTLVNYFHSHQTLTDQSYGRYLRWYKEEMQNLQDNIVSKDVFEATMYGMGYEENGIMRYMANANQGKIYSKVQALEQKGDFVGPILAKRYWYNYEYRLPDVISDFKKRLRETYPPALLQNIKAIVDKGGENENARALAEKARGEWGEYSLETIERYIHRWGLK